MSEVGNQTNGNNASAGAGSAAFKSARLDHVGLDVPDLDAQIEFTAQRSA